MKNKTLIISFIVALIASIALNISKILYMDDAIILNLIVTFAFIVSWITFIYLGFKNKAKGFFKYSMYHWILSIVNFGIIPLGYSVPALFNILMLPGTILSLIFSTPLYGFSLLLPKPFSPVTYSWVMLILSIICAGISLYGAITFKNETESTENDEFEEDDDEDF